jgi:hypothetical protein
VQIDERLREAPPLPKGAVLKPLDCRGPGSHDLLGYRCANAGVPGCLGFVCKRCAAKSLPSKPYCEECNVCQIAAKNSGSMAKAVAIIGELHPESVKRGKLACASISRTGKPCARCVQHPSCGHCLQSFHSHRKDNAFCSDTCRASARREYSRQYAEKRTAKKLSEVA